MIVDALVWAGWSALVGALGARWSDERVGRDGPLTTVRAFESGGELYRRLGIRRWKRWLPDAGGFAGGRPKRLEGRLDPAGWTALAVETRRAERVHWLILLALPVIALWTRGVLLGAMVAYAMLANAPCIAAQRYNRLRLAALRDRAYRRGPLG
jgi:glycosyl-4,4'-diaponeurosporenoate acyltransferase